MCVCVCVCEREREGGREGGRGREGERERMDGWMDRICKNCVCPQKIEFQLVDTNVGPYVASRDLHSHRINLSPFSIHDRLAREQSLLDG